MQHKFNVLTMDEHAEVHFGAGAVSYPPWIKKWLRWEFAQSILMMIHSDQCEVVVV